MPEARVGRAVHAALEQILQGVPVTGAVASARDQLENTREVARFDSIAKGIQAFVERIASFRQRRRVHRQFVEFALAIREDLSATQFYAGDAYFRGILDAAFIFDDDSLAVVDHKSGDRIGQRSIVEQLEGYAVLAAAYFRNVRRIWLGIHWVGETSVEWAEPVARSGVRQRLLPAVLNNIEAAALAVDDGPRANAGSWCERCSYRTICPDALDVRFEPVDDEPEPGI